jgi:hypothetical protein
MRRPCPNLLARRRVIESSSFLLHHASFEARIKGYSRLETANGGILMKFVDHAQRRSAEAFQPATCEHVPLDWLPQVDKIAVGRRIMVC